MYPSGRTKYIAPRFTPAWSILGRHGNVWQGSPLPLADLLELRCGFAINVHLPIERGQRGEVVGPVSRGVRCRHKPWQAIPPSELARLALAQAAGARSSGSCEPPA